LRTRNFADEILESATVTPAAELKPGMNRAPITTGASHFLSSRSTRSTLVAQSTRFSRIRWPRCEEPDALRNRVADRSDENDPGHQRQPAAMRSETAEQHDRHAFAEAPD
jgi:hypothetical protein